jgi:hypothetical protein
MDMFQAAKRVPFMTADEVVKMQGQEGITFVDVREPPEWVETGILVGALPVRAVYRDWLPAHFVTHFIVY